MNHLIFLLTLFTLKAAFKVSGCVIWRRKSNFCQWLQASTTFMRNKKICDSVPFSFDFFCQNPPETNHVYKNNQKEKKKALTAVCKEMEMLITVFCLKSRMLSVLAPLSPPSCCVFSCYSGAPGCCLPAPGSGLSLSFSPPDWRPVVQSPCVRPELPLTGEAVLSWWTCRQTSFLFCIHPTLARLFSCSVASCAPLSPLPLLFSSPRVATPGNHARSSSVRHPPWQQMCSHLWRQPWRSLSVRVPPHSPLLVTHPAPPRLDNQAQWGCWGSLFWFQEDFSWSLFATFVHFHPEVHQRDQAFPVPRRSVSLMDDSGC